MVGAVSTKRRGARDQAERLDALARRAPSVPAPARSRASRARRGARPGPPSCVRPSGSRTGRAPRASRRAARCARTRTGTSCRFGADAGDRARPRGPTNLSVDWSASGLRPRWLDLHEVAVLRALEGRRSRRPRAPRSDRRGGSAPCRRWARAQGRAARRAPVRRPPGARRGSDGRCSRWRWSRVGSYGCDLRASRGPARPATRVSQLLAGPLSWLVRRMAAPRPRPLWKAAVLLRTFSPRSCRHHSALARDRRRGRDSRADVDRDRDAAARQAQADLRTPCRHRRPRDRRERRRSSRSTRRRRPTSCTTATPDIRAAFAPRASST